MLARLSVFPNDASLEAATDVTGGDLEHARGPRHQQHGAAGVGRRIIPGSGCSRPFASTHSNCSQTTGDALRTVTLGISCSSWRPPTFAAPSRVVGWTSSTRSKTTSEPRSTTPTSPTTPRRKLRLVVALWRFWWLRGYLVEGRSRLEKAIARASEVAPRLRADAYRGGAGIAWTQGDLRSRPRARHTRPRGRRTQRRRSNRSCLPYGARAHRQDRRRLRAGAQPPRAERRNGQCPRSRRGRARGQDEPRLGRLRRRRSCSRDPAVD